MTVAAFRILQILLVAGRRPINKVNAFGLAGKVVVEQGELKSANVAYLSQPTRSRFSLGIFLQMISLIRQKKEASKEGSRPSARPAH